MLQKPNTCLIFCWIPLVTLVLQTPSFGKVEPARIFGDHMVLQRDRSLPIWGVADVGEKITVEFGEQKKTATTNEKRVWRLELDPLSASDKPREMTIEGSNKITYRDVLVGEVWFCSGQSNMSWPILKLPDAEQVTAAANFPLIRHASGQFGKWQPITPQGSRMMSAVAYFYGRELHRELNVPIGLIQSSVGGTRIESWTLEEAMRSHPTGREFLASQQKIIDEYDPEVARQQHEAALARWKAASERSVAQGRRELPKPRPPKVLTERSFKSGGLFVNKVRPSIPYAIRGVIWYQGESNAMNAEAYRDLLPLMIADWRAHWGQGEFPFLVVQLANFHDAVEEPSDSHWARLREAQSEAAEADENVGLAVAIDIGLSDNIHPPNKQEVGRRLALQALAIAYEKQVAHSGPVFKSSEVARGRVVLEFDFDKELRATNGEKLQGFAICGKDRRFVWANAVVEKDRIIVSHPSIADPVAVRYGWADNPPCNLTNASGLPAVPFRTDDWPFASMRGETAAQNKKRK